MSKRVVIMVEGGVSPASENRERVMATQGAGVLDNTNMFRLAFEGLFRQVFSQEQVEIIIEPSAGWKQARSIFLSKKDTELPLLLIDLDAPETQRTERLQTWELASYQQQVFFMIQKMEAWILSQPEVIDSYFANKRDIKQSQTDILLWQNPATVQNPDYALAIAIQRRFVSTIHKTKDKKPKKIKYGKLRHAPDLIQRLDVARLAQTFPDVQRLIHTIQILSA